MHYRTYVIHERIPSTHRRISVVDFLEFLHTKAGIDGMFGLNGLAALRANDTHQGWAPPTCPCPIDVGSDA